MINVNAEDLLLIKNILNTYLPGVPVWAFGSRVKGTAQPFSDLDLAILSSEPLSIELHTDLREAFSQSTLPFKVDFVDWPTLDDSFKKLIEEQHEPL